MSKIEQFEVMQETIRVLQEHRNNALDRLVGTETNNRFLTKRLSELLEAKKIEVAESVANETNNAVNQEQVEQNQKLREVVDTLTATNEQLKVSNIQLKRKLMVLQNSIVGKK